MVVTDYLYIFEGFIEYGLDYMVVKYCRQKQVKQNRVQDYRDEVISDLRIAFVESFSKPISTDRAVYLRSVLKKQAYYSLAKQIRSEIRFKRETDYYKQKNCRYINGRLVDAREKDPREKLFRLSFEDFDFSPLNNNELQVIWLFFGEDMKTKEIAEMLNISENSVRQSKSRALKKLYKPNLHLLN